MESLLIAADKAKRRLLSEPITKKEQVDDIFNAVGIDSIADRIVLLRQCMGVRWASNCKAGDIAANDCYKDEVAIFIDGTWRLLQA